MDADYLVEPELEFAAGKRHIDIRFGLANHGPLDSGKMRDIRLGVIGTPKNVERVREWLDGSQEGVPAKESDYPNLFVPFPGFQRTFQVHLVHGPELCATVPPDKIEQLCKGRRSLAGLEDALKLIREQGDYLIEKTKPDVILCAPPEALFRHFEGDTRNGESEDERDGPMTDPATDAPVGPVPPFHDLLKARCMWPAVPVQMIRPETYIPEGRRKIGSKDRRSQQDPATTAWNFYTAIYYKAGGAPWRVAKTDEYTACFVGIAFYRSADGSRVLTSMAQVFNLRGDGIVVRGGPAYFNKDDRNIHMDKETAAGLLKLALRAYHAEHHTQPARVVVHKSSPFDSDEIAGCRSAAETLQISSLDLLSLSRSDMRLFRQEYHPPLRGTMLVLDDVESLLYLRGSVPFFRTWPGQYIPRSIAIRADHAEAGLRALAGEILALSKLNWNNTQFDGGWPITLRAARQIGSILKHIPQGSDLPGRYSHWM